MNVPNEVNKYRNRCWVILKTQSHLQVVLKHEKCTEHTVEYKYEEVDDHV